MCDIREFKKIMDYCYEAPFNLHYAMGELARYEKFLKRLYWKRVKEEKDYRTGDLTYGYEFDCNSIMWHISYISDRWNCAFRIAWLIGLIEKWKGKTNTHFYKGN